MSCLCHLAVQLWNHHPYDNWTNARLLCARISTGPWTSSGKCTTYPQSYSTCHKYQSSSQSAPTVLSESRLTSPRSLLDGKEYHSLSRMYRECPIYESRLSVSRKIRGARRDTAYLHVRSQVWQVAMGIIVNSNDINGIGTRPKLRIIASGADLIGFRCTWATDIPESKRD